MTFFPALLDLYSLVVLVTVVTSWMSMDPRHPVVSVTRSLTEPVLGPIRRVLPAMGGLDFSPMVLLLLLRMLRGAF